MIGFVKTTCVCVLVAMGAATTWASLDVPLWGIPREIISHPWFVTTLLDTYFAFLAVWAWIAWRERTHLVRIGWLVAILLLGNFAIASYVLIQIRRLSPGESIDALMSRKTTDR